MKKSYSAPQMKVYEVRRTNVITTSGEQSTSQNEEYKKENVNSIWF